MASNRLARRNVAWNSSLVAFSTATAIASIGILVDDQMYGRGGEALMVALAVLSLVASLVVSNVNYGSRAKALEANYKQVQRISLAAERIDKKWADDNQRVADLVRDYELAIESSENHSEADYIRVTDEKMTKARWLRVAIDNLVSAAPYISLCVPVIITVPFIKWFIDGL